MRFGISMSSGISGNTLAQDQSGLTVCAVRSIPPRISTIIVSHNSRRDLQRCLDSLLEESLGEVEFILVDNASQDGSADYVAYQFPWINLVRCEGNLGFAAGCNAGARLAQGRYLLFLNPDTVVGQSAITRLAAFLDVNPKIGLVTPKILLLEHPDRINACGNIVHLSGLTLCRGAGLPADSLSALSTVDAVSGAAFMVRRRLFERLGGFDEDFFMYMEDTDLSIRARLAGMTCMCVPDARVYHDYTLQISSGKSFFLERNRYQMLLKSLRWRTLFLLLPLLALSEMVTWGHAFLVERSVGSKLHAYVWTVYHWGEVLQKRRAVQSTRKINDRELLSLHTSHLDFAQTGQGRLQVFAGILFNPVFYVYKQLLKVVLWW